MLADYEARLAEYWAELKTRDNVPTFGEFLEFVLAREPTGQCDVSSVVTSLVRRSSHSLHLNSQAWLKSQYKNK